MEFISNADPMAVTALTFTVIAFVKAFTSLVDRNWRSAGTIAVAGIVGALFAPYAGNLTWFTGLLIGFSASGLITTATRFGGGK